MPAGSSAARDALIVRVVRIRRGDVAALAVIDAFGDALADTVAAIDVDIPRVETTTLGKPFHGLFAVIGAARAAHEGKRSDRHDEQIHRFHAGRNAF